LGGPDDQDPVRLINDLNWTMRQQSVLLAHRWRNGHLPFGRYSHAKHTYPPASIESIAVRIPVQMAAHNLRAPAAFCDSELRSRQDCL
jgi:hypothetical protein